ncbi:Nitroreductase [Polyplosphaeria fusca]|uniref:Nitroreductase n=1 Tax=Polyplosphaeria fusca TaxID=682080 RepID=A0A9P4R1R4_9PLEO|nr:Nitroreductase [Polyplosphaeria fusca]
MTDQESLPPASNGDTPSPSHHELSHFSPTSPCFSPTHIANSLTKMICQRHSTRSFLPTPVPTPLLESVLTLAQHTPSNSNLQPWRLHIATGAALSRLSAALLAAAQRGDTQAVAPIPDEYRHYRSELGHQLYGPQGYNITRTDKEAARAAQLRNYRFFDAPVGVVVCMDGRLAQIDALSVGMYLQTLCLLLAERGLGTCVAVSTVAYPEVVRAELGIGGDMVLLTGLAVGYEDEGGLVNGLRVKRDAWRDCVTFVEE